MQQAKPTRHAQPSPSPQSEHDRISLLPNLPSRTGTHQKGSVSQNMLADMFLKAQIHALSLGFFASFAAPFGGFLSSAIKRAYGIKDNRGFGGTWKSLSICFTPNIFNQSVVSLMIMLEYEIEFLNSSVGFTI